MIARKMRGISELAYKFRRLNLLLVGVKYQNWFIEGGEYLK